MDGERIVEVIPGARVPSGTGADVYTLVATDRRLIAAFVDEDRALAEAREIHDELRGTGEGRIDVVACETRAHLRLAQRHRSLAPDELLAADPRNRAYEPGSVVSVEVAREYSVPVWPWEIDLPHLRITIEGAAGESGRTGSPVDRQIVTYHTETERPSLARTQKLLTKIFGTVVRV